jgi:hypothetical protein
MLRRQDVLGGLLLVVFGVLGLIFGASLDMGTARRMGPGFFPRLLSWLVILLGVTLAAMGARTAGEGVTRIAWRPLILVSAAVMAFWLLIDRAGLVAATVAVVMIGGLAGREAKLLEIGLLAIAMAIGTALLFVHALNLPLPLWGR